MRINNPACYECSKSKDTLHSWFLLNDGIRARCKHCKITLNEADSLEVYEYHLPKSQEVTEALTKLIKNNWILKLNQSNHALGEPS